MTNELVIDNNRKQKVSLAAKFPLTIAKKNKAVKKQGERGGAGSKDKERGGREGKSKSI